MYDTAQKKSGLSIKNMSFPIQQKLEQKSAQIAPKEQPQDSLLKISYDEGTDIPNRYEINKFFRNLDFSRVCTDELLNYQFTIQEDE